MYLSINPVSAVSSCGDPARNADKRHPFVRRCLPCGLGLLSFVFLVGCSKSNPAPVRSAAVVNGSTGVNATTGTATSVAPPAMNQQAAVSPEAPAPVVSPALPPATPVVPISTTPVTTPPKPIPAPPPQVVPAGTSLPVRLSVSLSSKNNNTGDTFQGELASPVRLKQSVVLPAGSTVNGVVTSAKSAGRFKGAASLSLKLVSVVVRGRRYAVETASISSESKGKGKRTGAMVGGGAGAGALIGGVAGGGKGALIGGLLGAGAGTAGAGMTGNNREITYGAESILTFSLSRSLTLGSRATRSDD